MNRMEDLGITDDSILTLQLYLKWLRLRNGYAQEYVADRINIIRQTYSHYETGRIYPSIGSLYRLCLLYDLPTCPALKLGAINELYIDSVDELEQMDNGVFMSDWADGNLQILVNGWFADYPNADGLLSYFETANSQHHSNFYSNEEFDGLMADARVELDESAQADLYKQADNIASRQDYAMIPLLYPHYNYAAKPYVLGHKVGNMSFDMWDIDIDAEHADYVG